MRAAHGSFPGMLKETSLMISSISEHLMLIIGDSTQINMIKKGRSLSDKSCLAGPTICHEDVSA